MNKEEIQIRNKLLKFLCDECGFGGLTSANTFLQKLAKKNEEPTKREYFAGLSMQGFCSLPGEDVEVYNLTPGSVAKMSVAQADAIIKELNKDVVDG